MCRLNSLNFNMKTTILSRYEFKEIGNWEHAVFSYSETLKMGICTAKSDYITISDFKALFTKISEHIDQFPLRHFLFDKRSLKTFHQPSMEWYFAIWKPEMKAKGLCRHYKILPSLDWFEKAVEAGKHEIFQKYGKEILKGIEITYVNTESEAVEKALATEPVHKNGIV